jgi:hypothetical protein
MTNHTVYEGAKELWQTTSHDLKGHRHPNLADANLYHDFLIGRLVDWDHSCLNQTNTARMVLQETEHVGNQHPMDPNLR